MKILSVHHDNGVTKFVVSGQDFPKSVHFKCTVWRSNEGLTGNLFFLIDHLIYSLSILHKKASPQLDLSSH